MMKNCETENFQSKNTNANLVKSQIEGYTKPEGKFRTLRFVDMEGKTAEGLNLKGELVKHTYEKLINDEWVEIDRSEMLANTVMDAISFPQFFNQTNENDKEETFLDESCNTENEAEITKLIDKANSALDIAILLDYGALYLKEKDFDYGKTIYESAISILKDQILEITDQIYELKGKIIK